MSKHDVIRNDLENPTDNPLDIDDRWFLPALLAGIALILIGSLYVTGN